MSSKRAQRRRSCGNKIRYDSIAEAKEVARRMRWQGEGRISAYWCKWCSGAHVGHTPRGIRQAMAQRGL